MTERNCTQSCYIKQELYKFQSQLEAIIKVDNPTANRIYELLDQLERGLNILVSDDLDSPSKFSPPTVPSTPSAISINNVVTLNPNPIEKSARRNENQKSICKCCCSPRKHFSF